MQCCAAPPAGCGRHIAASLSVRWGSPAPLFPSLASWQEDLSLGTCKRLCSSRRGAPGHCPLPRASPGSPWRAPGSPGPSLGLLWGRGAAHEWVPVGGWIGMVGSHSLGWSTPNQPTEQPGVFRTGVRTTLAVRSVRSLHIVVHTRMRAPAVVVAF